MPNIQPISILREKNVLDQISQSTEPLFITKNGSAYLVILSPESYDKIIKELNHYKQALQQERELHDLAFKVNQSRESIKAGKFYHEEEFDQMLEMAEILEHIEIAKLIQEREKEEATISFDEILRQSGIQNLSMK